MAGKTVEPGIRQLADRTYEVRVGVGRDETGRVVQRSRVVHGSIHEARKARAQLLLSAGATPKPSAATVAELGKRWLADLERRGKSPNTIHGDRPEPPVRAPGRRRAVARFNTARARRRPGGVQRSHPLGLDRAQPGEVGPAPGT